MSKTPRFFPASVVVLASCAQGPAIDDLGARITRLEIPKPEQAVAEMLDRIDRLQTGTQQLRGALDEIRHDQDRMQARQQNLYLDLDKRLLNLEAALSGSVSPRNPEIDAEGNSPAPEYSEPPSPESKIIPPEDPLTQDTSAGEKRAGSDLGTQENIYQEAFVYLNNGRYDDAIANFSRLIEAYPTGEYADNAQYWLGETFYVRRDFDSARFNFNQVMEKYPHSNKIPDAMLKLGFLEYELASWKSAREILNSVIDQYPLSNAARLAQERLDQMRKERH